MIRAREPRLLGVRREVAAVVHRPLLVAERLEPVLEVLLELLIELVRLQLERFVERAAGTADHALPEREEELPNPFLAPPGFHEFEGRVAQVVDEARIRGAAISLHLAHLRHDVGDRGVAHRRQVERRPVAGHEVGQSLGDPQRVVPADQRLRDDVELEDVRQLVRDRAVEQVRRLVERQQHPIACRLGERRDPLAHRARDDVLLLEIDVRLEDDQRHLERQVVLEVRADRLVGALGVAGHTLEVRLHLAVVVDLEVVGRVDLPVEVAVVNQVLPEIRNESCRRRLRLRRPGEAAHGHGQDDGDQRRSTRTSRAPAHSIHLVRGRHLPEMAPSPWVGSLPARPSGRNRWLDLNRSAARVIPVAIPVRTRAEPLSAASILPPVSSRRSGLRVRQMTAAAFLGVAAVKESTPGGITRDLGGF